MAFANHPLNYTPQAFELPHKGNPTSIDAGGLFLILTKHYLLATSAVQMSWQLALSKQWGY